MTVIAVSAFIIPGLVSGYLFLLSNVKGKLSLKSTYFPCIILYMLLSGIIMRFSMCFPIGKTSKISDVSPRKAFEHLLTLVDI